jgi:hypothetical protein
MVKVVALLVPDKVGMVIVITAPDPLSVAAVASTRHAPDAVTEPENPVPVNVKLAEPS